MASSNGTGTGSQDPMSMQMMASLASQRVGYLSGSTSQLSPQQRTLVLEHDNLIRERRRIALFRPSVVCPRLNVLNHKACAYCGHAGPLQSIAQPPQPERYVYNVTPTQNHGFQPFINQPRGVPFETDTYHQPQVDHRIVSKPDKMDMNIMSLISNDRADTASIQTQTTSSRGLLSPPINKSKISQPANALATDGVAPKRTRRKSQKLTEPPVVRPTIFIGGRPCPALYGDLVEPHGEDDDHGNFPLHCDLNFNGPFRFMDLPAEIRVRIYRYVVDNGEHGLLLPQDWKANHQPPITRVNRSIRNETIPIFYAQNIFYAKNRELCKVGPVFVDAIGDARCRLIRHFKWFTAKRTIELEFSSTTSRWDIFQDGPKGRERSWEIQTYLNGRTNKNGIGVEDINYITGAVLRINTKD